MNDETKARLKESIKHLRAMASENVQPHMANARDFLNVAIEAMNEDAPLLTVVDLLNRVVHEVNAAVSSLDAARTDRAVLEP